MNRISRSISHNESPRLLSLAENDSQFIRKVSKSSVGNTLHLSSNSDTVPNIQPTQLAIEARNVLRIMQLQKVRQGMVSKHGPGRRRGGHFNRLRVRHGAQFRQ